jgi:hypothetical protein
VVILFSSWCKVIGLEAAEFCFNWGYEMPVDVLSSVAMVLGYDEERNDMVVEADACREMGFDW